MCLCACQVFRFCVFRLCYFTNSLPPAFKRDQSFSSLFTSGGLPGWEHLKMIYFLCSNLWYVFESDCLFKVGQASSGCNLDHWGATMVIGVARLHRLITLSHQGVPREFTGKHSLGSRKSPWFPRINRLRMIVRNSRGFSVNPFDISFICKAPWLPP